MNKIKLGEILKVKHGFAFKSQNYVNKSEFVLVTLANISSTNNFQFNEKKLTYYNGEFPNEYILNEDDLIIPLTEQVIGLFGNTAFIPKVKGISFLLNQRVGKIIPIKNRANNYYLHYLLATDLVRKQLEHRASGTKQRNISPNDVYDVTVFICDVKEQKKIGELLYNMERKINLNNKINDNLEKQMKLLYEIFMFKAENKKINGSFVTARDLVEVLTGKEDANFSIQNGKFNFFTCSNEILKCNEYKYDSSSILIAGNGDFNVKHYTGKFNAYQRTYILTPQKDYYALLYLASLYRIESFKSKSTGSIVKFITKEDIENIPLFIPENKSIINILNKMIILKENNFSENEILIKLRDFLLPLLMNGQATISE